MRSRRFGALNPLVLGALVWLGVLLPWPVFAASSGFRAQARIGYRVGDQWEPAIAADGSGNIYILYPQYGTVPGCPACRIPAMILLSSPDNGLTWQKPRTLYPAATGQFDPQIVVDPVDRRTVYAAWLQNDRRDMVLAKSADFGATWSAVIAHSTSWDLDKPVLAVHGANLYLGFNHRQTLWVAFSHDGGVTFSSAEVQTKDHLAWSQAGGATVDPAGNVYFSWTGYIHKDADRGPLNLYVSKSADGGLSWTTSLLSVSGGAPECKDDQCESEFLSPQIAMASDSAGTLYALWNSGSAEKGAQRIYFASSTTGGSSWSTRQDISVADIGIEHAFPAITAGGEGDVRIAWMDARHDKFWNTRYRSSTNGGASWTPEVQLSHYTPGYSYIKSAGFSFPFGDYFSLTIDNRGDTHAVWGEGQNYQSPGSIWYTTGR